jgi:ADP-dependent phosphofructokinase/glucokinase
MTAKSWPERYGVLLSRLADYVDQARLTLCGLASCADAYRRLAETYDVLANADKTEPAALAAELLRRLRCGLGGEYRMEWPEGELWASKYLPVGSWGLGGTGAQAAQMLAALGAPALISLEDRSRRQLSLIHPKVLVADASGIRHCGDLVGGDQPKPAHYVFEVTSGDRIGPVAAQRSTRTIVRFHDDRLDHDPDFVRESMAAAGAAGAAILCGFNEVADEQLDESLETTIALVKAWRARGLKLIHLELGGYTTEKARDVVLRALGPVVTSLGMNLSEIRELRGEDVTNTAAELCDRFGLARVCVHADTWALVVTGLDPALELEALLCGCLLASYRAEHGQVMYPKSIPRTAVYEDPPWPLFQRLGRRSVVCCASPYLRQPVATIGLGDTFLAGTLLVLGGDRPAQ